MALLRAGATCAIMAGTHTASADDKSGRDDKSGSGDDAKWTRQVGACNAVQYSAGCGGTACDGAEFEICAIACSRAQPCKHSPANTKSRGMGGRATHALTRTVFYLAAGAHTLALLNT